MTLSTMIGMIGTQEILIIFIIVLLLFGGRKIPELMRGLGKGMKEFKTAQKEDSEEEGKGNKAE